MNDRESIEKLRYPIGKFKYKEDIAQKTTDEWINEIEILPKLLREAVENLSQKQLDTQYRPGGWTVRQVVHHIGDSHLNSYVRFKLALTEEKPVIKTYDEALWAKLNDYKLLSIDDSLRFIEFLHKRWVVLLRSLDENDFNKTFIHPESGETSLKRNLGIYAWHGKHHLAHINSLKMRMNW